MIIKISLCIEAFWFHLLLHGAFGQQPWKGQSTNETVRKGETVTLTCGVNERRGETVSWFKGSSKVSENQIVNSDFRDRFSIRGDFNLIISNVQPIDNDQYTCNVSGLGNSSAYLKVLYEPVVSTQEVKVYVHLNYSAWFSCYILANPSPSISWYKDGQRVNTSINLDITTRKWESNYRSKLLIMKATLQDLGEYTCWAENEMGNGSRNFILDQKTVPEAPTNVTFLNQTWDSVLLAWRPGFDGGLSQNFVINVTTSGNEPRLVNVWPPTASVYNITRLKPQQIYQFEVVGKNEVGQGEPSEGISVETEDLYIQSFTEIEFDLATGQLILDQKIPKNHYIRVYVKYSNTGDEWKILYMFMHFQHLRTRIEVPNITALKISVCLNGRSDVCGDPVVATLKNSDPGLSRGTIVGICISVVVFFAAILAIIYLFIRKRNMRRGNILS